MNDIVLHLDETVNEYPGEMSGFMLMFLSVFFYGTSICYAIVVGVSNTITICVFSVAILLQISVPLGGIIEVICSGKGTLDEGIRNSLKGAGSILWCCCE